MKNPQIFTIIPGIYKYTRFLSKMMRQIYNCILYDIARILFEMRQGMGQQGADIDFHRGIWYNFSTIYGGKAAAFCFRRRGKENSMRGTLVGVGVGPGDPELLTLKAMKRMEQCDVLVVPDADKGESTAYKIALQAYPELEKKPTVTVRMPMTHDMAQWRASHRAAADQIEQQLDQGKMVVFLTLGDPTVYATYIYVHKMVASDGYPTEIVSGIPSFCAAAARLNIGLSEGSQMLHIVPSSHGITQALKLPGVKVLMKAGSKMPQVRKELMESGMEVSMVENCGMPQEHVYRSAEEIPENAGYFSLIIAKDPENRK